MPSSFEFNEKHKAAFGAQVLASDWMAQLMLRQAEKGAEAARDLAPVETGRYRDGIGATVYLRRVVPVDTPGPGRAVGRVTASDPKSSVIEHGTSRTPAHRTLGRAMGAMKEL